MEDKMNVRKSVVSFGVIILLSLIITCCKTSGPINSIKIGLLVAETDINNPDFVSDKDDRIQSAELAVSEINNGGGIYGRPIELLVEDTQNFNLGALQKARKLIKEDVVAIVGPNTSAGLEYIADSLTTKKGIIVISASATSPVISNLKSDTNNTVWRVCPSDEFQANIAAKYLKNDLKIGSIGIIFIDNVYGKSFVEALDKRLNFYKIKITSKIPYPPEAADNLQYDFGKFMPPLFKSNPEAVYIISTSEAGKILTDMASYVESKKIKKPILMGTDGNYDYRVLANTNLKFAEGMIGTAPAPSKEDNNFKLFKENFHKKYNREVKSVWAPETYDAVYLISYAMMRAGVERMLNSDGKTISKIISQYLPDVAAAGTSVKVNDFINAANILRGGGKIDYQGASGDVAFDNKGDVTGGTYLFWKVQDGNFVEFKTERYP
jgi:branched-chain amino acid transport system substrate-binding protein